MLESIKKFIKKHFGSFVYFYRYLKYKIYISIALSIVVGVLDGFGMAMFLPLLQMVDEKASVQPEKLGRLKFLLTGAIDMGIPINITSVLFIMLVFFILKGAVKFAESYYKLNLELGFIKQIRFTNINLLSGFKYSSFVKSDSGQIQNTFSGEVEKVIQAYRTYFVAFQYGVFVAVYIFMAFTVNAQFAILVAIGGGLMNFTFKRFHEMTKDNSRKITTQLHSFQSLLIQAVSNFKYLKATGLMPAFSQKLRGTIDKTQDSQRKIGLLSTWLVSTREPLVMLVIVSVILLQVNVFHQGLAPIILCLLFFYRSLTFLMGLQNYWNVFLSVAGSMENMEDFTKELARNQVIEGSVIFTRFKDKIELNKLNFSYNDVKILKDITLQINRCETIALVGESGSGKTTLMNVLAGLLQANERSYTIDGIDIGEINVNSFNKRIGYITQEPVIFNDTVFNNVTFWDEPTEANVQRFEKALKSASIYQLVANLPEKEQTSLGDSGIVISGGQRQRISIARELYKDVDILFMDEATSALDSQTEHEIQQSINELRGSYTIVIVAHRLSTVKTADKIVYLSGGLIEDIGTFDELKASSERFKLMTSLQEF